MRHARRPRCAQARFVLAAAAALWSGGRDARAALAYWDHNGATAGTGSATPSGTWGTPASWSPSAAGTAATATWTSGDVAVFSAGSDATGAFTVTISASQTASGVTIEEGTIAFASGTLDLSGAATIDVASSLNTTMSSSLSISGSSGLAKTGAGTLQLFASNVYTGDTTLSGGTVSINSGSDLGNQVNPATLHLSGGTLTTTASRSPTTALIGNPIDVTADSAITTTSTAGTVDLNLFSSTVTAAAASTLTFQNNAASGSGVFQPRFSGGNFTYNGKIAINNGAFGTTVLQAFNIFTNDQTFNGVISGNGSFKRTASTAGQGGNTIFTAANTYSGGTALNDGGIGLGIDSTGSPGALTSGPIGTGALTTAANAKLFAVGGPRTVGNAIIFGGAGFTLIVTGSNDLTLSGGVALGTSSRTFQVDSGAATTVAGVISGTANLTKTGTGVLTLAGTNTYSGTTNVNAGVLAIVSTGNLGGGNAVLGGGTLRTLAFIPVALRDITVAAAGGTIDTNGNIAAFGNIDGSGALTKTAAGALGATHVRTTSLTISGGRVFIAPQADPHAPASSAGVSKLATLTTSAGKLDIGNSKLILTTAGAVGTFNGTAYTATTGQIATGRNTGAWDGASGIVTSQSDATSGTLTSIGIATAAQAKGIATTATATWAGQTVTGSDTLVMYTYGGDANLDGKLNVDDYGRIDSNIGLGTAGWYNGDFNYDGKVNVDDYGIIDSNIGIQGPPFSTGPGNGAASLTLAAVPEPAAISSLSLAAVLLLRRRLGSSKRAI
jgi:autotransporter-associated beta strand protein